MPGHEGGRPHDENPDGPEEEPDPGESGIDDGLPGTGKGPGASGGVHVHITVNHSGAQGSVLSSTPTAAEGEGHPEHGFHSHFVDANELCSECGTQAKRD